MVECRIEKAVQNGGGVELVTAAALELEEVFASFSQALSGSHDHHRCSDVDNDCEGLDSTGSILEKWRSVGYKKTAKKSTFLPLLTTTLLPNSTSTQLYLTSLKMQTVTGE